MRLQAIRTEALWLLSCYVLTFVLYGMLAGSWLFWQSTLDIQMHNTYFVVSNTVATVPFFLILALVVTSARIIGEPLRTRYTWVVLLVLSTVVLLIILLIALMANRVIR